MRACGRDLGQMCVRAQIGVLCVWKSLGVCVCVCAGVLVCDRVRVSRVCVSVCERARGVVRVCCAMHACVRSCCVSVCVACVLCVFHNQGFGISFKRPASQKKSEVQVIGGSVNRG